MKQNRLMIGAAAGFVAAVCLLVWGCPLALMPELPGSGKKAGEEDSVVREYNLQAYVPVPTEGAAPVKAVEGRRDLEGSVVWMDEGGQALPGNFAVFELGAVYQAAISLRAKDNYAFDPAISFKYYPADAVASQPEMDSDAGDAGRTRARSVTVAYKAAAAPIPLAEDFDLTLHVPRPVTGEDPVRAFHAETFGGIVEWTPADGVFQAGKSYTAAVSLYPGAGYVFPEGTIQVVHSGAVSSPISFGSASGGRAAGDLEFPPAAGAQDIVTVNDLDLTDKVPAPVTGGEVEASVNAPQYAGKVSWTTEGDEPPKGVFKMGKVYTATAELVAASGYTFTGVTKNAFTHDGASGEGPANAANSGTVTIVFPATTEEMAETVDDFDLSGKIPVPTGNGKAEFYFSSTQYSGNVVWSPVPKGGVFQKGTEYTAKAELKAATGYVFTGVPENAFTHTGASGKPTNAKNSPLVTITFPVNDFLVVDDLDLTPYLAAPEPYEVPQTSFSASQYTGAVVWQGSFNDDNGTFKAGETYRATVTLTGILGYAFNGVAKDAFIYEGAISVTNAANTGLVTIDVKGPEIQNPWYIE